MARSASTAPTTAMTRKTSRMSMRPPFFTQAGHFQPNPLTEQTLFLTGIVNGLGLSGLIWLAIVWSLV